MPQRNARWPILDRLLLGAMASLAVYGVMQVGMETWQWWQSHPRPGAQVYQQYVERTTDGKTVVAVVNYLLYLPPDYAPTRSWPLVIFLHGSGERGYDLELVRSQGLPKRIEEGRWPSFLLVSPQCLPGLKWEPKDVVALVEHVSATLPVDRNRIYLTGYSMGGFATWNTACYAPGRFAAIVPVAGGGDVEQAPRIAEVPVWAFHGEEDKMVPLWQDKEMVEAVRRCGGQVRFTVFPGLGHPIFDNVYLNPEVLEWLLGQQRK